VGGGENGKRAGAEILDGSAVEIRIDHRGTDVRAARNGRGIPELPADAPHHRRYHLLRFALALRRTVLGKCDRREQRPAPRPEILRRELLAEVFAHVVVQARTGRVARAVVPDVSKESPAARKREQLVDLAGELVVDERPAHLCRRPAASTPVACSFAPGLGEKPDVFPCRWNRARRRSENVRATPSASNPPSSASSPASVRDRAEQNDRGAGGRRNRRGTAGGI